MPLASALALALALSLGACGDEDDDCTGPECEPSPYLALDSPANVIANLELAYEERNQSEYERLFSTELVFEFSPVDSEQGTTPESWGRAEELASSQAMFTEASVSGIQFSQFAPAAAVPATAGDEIPSTQGVVRITVEGVRLSVFTRLQDDEILELSVNGEQAVFFLRDEGTAQAPRWQIVRWRDNPTAGRDANSSPATEEFSWGSIKARFGR